MRVFSSYCVLQLLGTLLNIDTAASSAGPGRETERPRQAEPCMIGGRLQLYCHPAGGGAAELLSMVLKIRLALSSVLNSSELLGSV